MIIPILHSTNAGHRDARPARQHGDVTRKFDAIGHEENHLHILVRGAPRYSPSRIMQICKSILAIQIFKKFTGLRKQLRKGHIWSPSYYVGTAGTVTSETIRKYIQEQETGGSIPPLNKLGGILEHDL